MECLQRREFVLRFIRKLKLKSWLQQESGMIELLRLQSLDIVADLGSQS
jgi:uncharacterized protein YjiS (DUF1127 family)